MTMTTIKKREKGEKDTHMEGIRFLTQLQTRILGAGSSHPLSLSPDDVCSSFSSTVFPALLLEGPSMLSGVYTPGLWPGVPPGLYKRAP
jgi:hypothetical protein